MVRIFSIVSVIAALFLTARGANIVPAASAAGIGSAEVSAAIGHASTGPLRDMKPRYEAQGPARDKPLRLIPTNGANAGGPDTALQSATTGPAIAVSGASGFAGVGNGDYGFTPNAAPPDTNGAVGATQYVQWVNESFAVFNKSTHALLYGPTAGNSLFQSLGSKNGCAVNNDGDPIAQYDKIANRWILTQFSVTSPSTYGYLQCVAVSKTSDATGAYNVYAFSEPYFNDYPKLNVWPDAYYVTFNMFNGNTFVGARDCALDRNSMLNGLPATQQCFQLGSSYGGLLGADLDGASSTLSGTSPTGLPPAGSPNYTVSFGTNSLNVWKFHVDWTTPANSTFTGPAVVSVAGFSEACSGGTCIPQPGTRQKLDSLADRLMYRLAYRHFADGHEALVVNHSVVAGSSTGVRWYELRVSNGSLSVYQQGTYAPDSNYRWMGSVAQDRVGNIAAGYSVSSSSIYPGIRVTGRVPGDPLGTLETESTVRNGGGSQLRTLNRWGDYSSMSVDPVDDCTFYYTTEYLKSSGTFNWSTYIYTFKLPGC